MTRTPNTTPPDGNEPPSTTTPRQRWYSRAALGNWIESTRVSNVIIVVIIINAATLGFETSDSVMARYGDVLVAIDQICLVIFVVELLIKLYAFGFGFFRNSWNVFDFIVVVIALIPGSGAFGVLRSLRVLRVLRLISMVPQLRRVVEALVRAIPGILSIGALLLLLFYVCAVMATKLFGDEFPEEFGNLGKSLFSLFQIMTLDGWSDMTRRMLPVFPWALGFFVPYVLLSAFTVLNLFIAVIVDAMSHLRDDDIEASDGEPAGSSIEEVVPQLANAHTIGEEVHALRKQVAELTALVRAQSLPPTELPPADR